MQRPERIIIIGLSALVCGIVGFYTGGNQIWELNIFGYNRFESIAVFTIPIAFIAVLANYTAIQRIHFCYKYLNNTEGSESSK